MKKRNPLLWLGFGYLALLLLFAIFGPTFRYHYLETGTPFVPPGGAHWLGTDEQGRDILARLAYGARLSLLIGLSVQATSLLVGILVGVIGTYTPRWIATPTMRLTDSMFAFPDILLGILLIGVFSTAKFPESVSHFLESGVIPVIVALAITSWPSIARLVRSQLVTLKDREFVVASQASGASTYYLITRHVLPQLWGLLLAVTMVELAGTILAESTLSFIGIGIRPPNPSWGGMINNARQDMNSHPMILVWPCLVLSLTIFALNFVGDGLRTLTDPKGR